MKKQELLRRIGSIDTFCRAEEFVFTSGRARGSRGIRVKCGDLAFTVLPDRAMDIAYAELAGIPLSYDSCTGIVSPAHYREEDFLRSFTAGLLTTCGLVQTGAPCTDEGVNYGLHGRIGNTPAYDVAVSRGWEGEDYVLTIAGRIRQSATFGEHLELCRTISVKLFSNTINICDTVINNGFEASPLMLLYHMNFGYPLVDAGTRFTTNAQNPIPATDVAAAGLQDACEFTAPQHGFSEQVFWYHSVQSTRARLTNPDGLYAEISYDGSNLPYLIEWKQLGEGTYVVGMDPSTNTTAGRAAEKAAGRLGQLAPGEQKQFEVTLHFGKE